MQELIDRLDKTEKQLDKENNLIMSCALFAAKNMAIEALAKEKEQIRLAFREGHDYWGEISSNDYYKQTYNNERIN